MSKRIVVIEPDLATRRQVCLALEEAGFDASPAANGRAALREMQRRKCDLALAPITLAGASGLEILGRRRGRRTGPKLLLLIDKEAPETLLRAMSEGAFDYVPKPVDPKELVRLARNAVATKPGTPAIEIFSALANWLELSIPCDLGVAERVTRFLGHLQADLPDAVRERAIHALRELLHNAIEWGGGLDPKRKVLISRLRTRRVLLYCIADPGRGFRFDGLRHAALANPPDQPTGHLDVRRKMGMRPGGFGLVLVKELVDELLFNQAQNEVAFVVYLDQ